jgi:hypothetical protein
MFPFYNNFWDKFVIRQHGEEAVSEEEVDRFSFDSFCVNDIYSMDC